MHDMSRLFNIGSMNMAYIPRVVVLVGSLRFTGVVI